MHSLLYSDLYRNSYLFVCILCIVAQCLERLAAIDRVLSVPGGALLLCGPCGSGRHSLLQLMAYMHHMEFWTPKMSRCVCLQPSLRPMDDVAGRNSNTVLMQYVTWSHACTVILSNKRHLYVKTGVREVRCCYDEQDQTRFLEFGPPVTLMCRGYAIIKFRNDLKDVMRLAGIEGKRALLYLEDHQLADPGALEAVISLLAGGEVPGLFTPEDMSKELATLDRKRNADVAYQVITHDGG